MKTLSSLAALLVLFSGCVSLMRPDQSIPAFKANYPTAEFRLNNEIHHGTASVRVNLGQKLNDLNLEVQGYLSGTIKVDSNQCGISKSFTYTNSKLLKINLPSIVRKSCIISILVQSDLPGYNELTQFKGRILVKALKPEEKWISYTSKIRVGEYENTTISYFGDGKVKVIFRGCGVIYEKYHKIYNNSINLNTKDITGLTTKETCPLEGALIKDKKIRKISWTIFGYDKFFSPFPYPEISNLNEKDITFHSDKSSAFISLGKNYTNKTNKKFKFDKKLPYIFRAISSKGRSVVCQWQVDQEIWLCLN